MGKRRIKVFFQFTLKLIDPFGKLRASYKVSNPLNRSLFFQFILPSMFTKDLYYNLELYHLNIILKLFRSTEKVFFPYCRFFSLALSHVQNFASFTMVTHCKSSLHVCFVVTSSDLTVRYLT